MSRSFRGSMSSELGLSLPSSSGFLCSVFIFRPMASAPARAPGMYHVPAQEFQWEKGGLVSQGCRSNMEIESDWLWLGGWTRVRQTLLGAVDMELAPCYWLTLVCLEGLGYLSVFGKKENDPKSNSSCSVFT
ncbi:hypothetical protein HJG60_008142 [Phyllostomus discolor]|uniref:Uncharacterized protein n=1 Tax=Phyllostomus discolor TaxID=89673 RepID=A0A834DQ23_9CHIR|nr:hypothetical protein HJG60_008142 [Phyllostomus discolor]